MIPKIIIERFLRRDLTGGTSYTAAGRTPGHRIVNICTATYGAFIITFYKKRDGAGRLSVNSEYAGNLFHFFRFCVWHYMAI